MTKSDGLGIRLLLPIQLKGYQSQCSLKFNSLVVIRHPVLPRNRLVHTERQLGFFLLVLLSR
jgi:hypothetical protein